MNLSTAFKSNGFKSTYSKSNYDTKENISNISLTPYKKNMTILRFLVMMKKIVSKINCPEIEISPMMS